MWWSPDGRNIAFTKGGGANSSPTIYIRRDSGKAKALISGDCPAWSPSGQRLAFIDAKGNGIATVNLAGRDEQMVVRVTATESPSCPEWWPDGRIAWVNSFDGRVETAAVEANGSVIHKLPIYADFEPPSESRDAAHIVYGVYSSGWTTIYVADPDGSHQRVLTRVAEEAMWPLWSPDGKRITFGQRVFTTSSDRSGRWRTWVINADGSGRMRLASSAWHDSLYGPDFPASWSPNGEEIAATELTRDGGWQLYVMRSDGSRKRPFAGE